MFTIFFKKTHQKNLISTDIITMTSSLSLFYKYNNHLYGGEKCKKIIFGPRAPTVNILRKKQKKNTPVFGENGTPFGSSERDKIVEGKADPNRPARPGYFSKKNGLGSGLGLGLGFWIGRKCIMRCNGLPNAVTTKSNSGERQRTRNLANLCSLQTNDNGRQLNEI